MSDLKDLSELSVDERLILRAFYDRYVLDREYNYVTPEYASGEVIRALVAYGLIELFPPMVAVRTTPKAKALIESPQP